MTALTSVRSLEVSDSRRAHVVDLGLETFKDALDTLEDWVVFHTSLSARGIIFSGFYLTAEFRTLCLSILTSCEGLSTLSSREMAALTRSTVLSVEPFQFGSFFDLLDLVFESIGIRNGSFVAIDVLEDAEHVIELNKTHLVSKLVSEKQLLIKDFLGFHVKV
jgi:hypothetical protein